MKIDSNCELKFLMNRRHFLSLSAASAVYSAFSASAQRSAQQTPLTLQTRYTSVQIDDRGFITSLRSRQSGKEYSPAGHPSPLLSLHESGQPNDRLMLPTSAVFHAKRGRIVLKYPNGSVAVVKMAAKEDYLRFQLVSLNPRGSVDNIVWGPLHTTVSKLIGDIIGVVRDDDWAIGMLGLDDNTITGPVTDSDCAGMGYYVHSPDPVKYPVPPQYKEGEWFNIGGNGISDGEFTRLPGRILSPNLRKRRQVRTRFRLHAGIPCEGSPQDPTPISFPCCPVSSVPGLAIR